MPIKLVRPTKYEIRDFVTTIAVAFLFFGFLFYILNLNFQIFTGLMFFSVGLMTCHVLGIRRSEHDFTPTLILIVAGVLSAMVGYVIGNMLK